MLCTHRTTCKRTVDEGLHRSTKCYRGCQFEQNFKDAPLNHQKESVLGGISLQPCPQVCLLLPLMFSSTGRELGTGDDFRRSHTKTHPTACHSLRKNKCHLVHLLSHGRRVSHELGVGSVVLTNIGGRDERWSIPVVFLAWKDRQLCSSSDYPIYIISWVYLCYQASG